MERIRCNDVLVFTLAAYPVIQVLQGLAITYPPISSKKIISILCPCITFISYYLKRDLSIQCSPQFCLYVYRRQNVQKVGGAGIAT